MLKTAHRSNGTTRQVHLAGWKRQSVDTRDEFYALKLQGALLGRPASCDQRVICSPVEDQGELGSCTAQMCAALIESSQNRAAQAAKKVAPLPPTISVTDAKMVNGVITFATTVTPPASPSPAPKFTNVSRLFGYYSTRLAYNAASEDCGATIRDTIKAAAKYGVVDETLWPYVIAKFSTNPPKTVWDAAAKTKVTSYHSIADGDLESMKVAVSQGFLVGFGFAVFDAFLTSNMASKGLLVRPKTTEVMQGGHAVCLVGYDDKKAMPDGSVGAFLVRNSWGTSWGLGGYYWHAYNYVADKKLCNDFWVVQASPI